MIIGIDIREWQPGVRTGFSRFLEGSLCAAAAGIREDNFILFGDSTCEVRVQERNINIVRVPARWTPWWDQVSLPRQLARHRVSVLLSPYYKAPLRAPCPVVLTIHDLFFIGYPGCRRPFYDAIMTRLAQEIQELLKIGPDCDGYLLRSLNHFLGREIRHCSWFDYRFLRLFNKRKGHYDLTAKVLDQFACTGTVGKLKNHLIHHQTESLEEYLRKMTRLFAPLTADEYIQKSARICWWNLPWYLILRPGLVFVYMSIYTRGFLDGIPGLIICLNSAILYF